MPTKIYMHLILKSRTISRYMKKACVYKSLLNYRKKGMSSFHTPGHKNNFLKLKKLINLDYTELKDTDNLYEPLGPIKYTEEKASKVFKSGFSLISATGCTLCVQAMIKLFCKNGGKVICNRMMHKSAVNIMQLLNIIPIWLELKVDKTTNFYLPPDCNEIESLLKKSKNVSAVYITSPDYYGTIADIGNISKICKKYNTPLLVDNAHGSHLAFFKPNLHPLALGADAVADSLHKTLPVLTGGAILHLKDKRLLEKAKRCMEFFGSSSPSFLIMASIDICLDWLINHGESAFFKLIEKTNEINLLAKSRGIVVPLHTRDDTRLFFNVKSIGLTGEDCANHFRKYKVEPEFFSEDFVVLIPSPFNTKKDFSRLKEGIKTLCKKNSVSSTASTRNYAKKLSNDLVINYPPGVPRILDI